jgi:hypothetical protein
VFDLAAEQRGVTGTTASGALVIDGQPYTPGIPAHLRGLPALPPFATVEERAAHAKLVEEREPYRIRTLGLRDHLGDLTLACPASTLVKGMRCDNKPASLTRLAPGRLTVGTALPIIGMNPLPAICAQQRVKAAFEELPFWQPDTWMSPAWQASYNRRNIIEGVFGNLKNDASEDITRGSIRVMGRAKNTLLLLFSAMANNLRVITIHDANRTAAAAATAAPARKTRTPRRRTRLVAETQVRIAARRIQHEHDRAALVTLAATAAGSADQDTDGAPEPGDPPPDPWADP